MTNQQTKKETEKVECNDPDCKLPSYAHTKVKPEGVGGWELMEKLADIEHQRWADWQSYVHKKLTYSEYKKDGKNWACYVLDPSDYERWETQIDMGYEELSEKEKESDREQVRRYLPIISNLLLQEKAKWKKIRKEVEEMKMTAKRYSNENWRYHNEALKSVLTLIDKL